MRLAILQKTTVIMFIAWLLIVPPGSAYILYHDLPQGMNWSYFFLFALLGILTVLYPIKLNGKPINLVSWVTIPAFLLFGLFFEMLIMQISILGTAFSYKKQSNTITRILFNSIVFFILSVISASVFFLAGGEIGSLDFWPIIFAVIVYQMVHRGLYNIAQMFYDYLIKRQNNYFTKDVLLENAIAISILPFAITLYFLVEYIGIGAFLLLGIPLFYIIIIIRLYSMSEKINHHLQLAGAIGHDLSNLLTEEEVIDQFVQKVSKMLKAEFTYLFDHHNGWLELIRSYEHDSFKDIQMNRIFPGEGIAGLVLQENRPVIYAKREDWIALSNDSATSGMQSIITIPFSRNEKIEGVLLLSSTKRDAFQDYQLKILDILCSYFAVSVEKARNFEETVRKSQRCGLTKLYNYLYLNERIHFEWTRIKHGNLNELSVLILDIDHFKQVNDTYGHQSGNDILIDLARILEGHVPKNGIVGRYGGEEFIYILPNMSKSDTRIFAESLREFIESHRFQITPDLSDYRNPVKVAITVSIGVSSFPEDTDDAKELFRYADRALYLGAKRTGRNRVAEYVK